MTGPVSIGGYALLRRLGAGATGEVFLVQHPHLPRQDALTLFSGAIGSDGAAKARLFGEADVLSTLSHPNIVRLYDRGEEAGRLWLTMEYVEGADAAQLLRQHGPMPADLALPVIDGVGSALDYGHRVRGVSHGDVKPANILIGFANGAPASVKLTDFGISRAVAGRPVDHRSDQYALACTAFELLTGAPPYPQNGAGAGVAAQVTAPPRLSERAPHLGTAADPVFARALANDPAQRFATNAEFTAALRATLPVAPPATAPAGPAKSRRGLLIAGALATTILVGAGIATAVVMSRDTSGDDGAPTGPGAPTVAAGPTVSCTFTARPGRAASLRETIAKARTQITEQRTRLSALPAEQQAAMRAQIEGLDKQLTVMEKMLPAIEKLDERTKSIAKPDAAVPSTGTANGTIATNVGAIGFTLGRSKAPCNVRTVETLMQAKFYDDTVCHRETNAPSTAGGGLYVLQCGDPTGTGVGGPGWTSPDENPTFLKAAATTSASASPQVVYPAGTLAVANSNTAADPITGKAGTVNTGGSQFFIVYQDTTLPPSYAVIGTVDDAGLKVVQQIAAKGIVPADGATPGATVTDGKPKDTVTISSMALSP